MQDSAYRGPIVQRIPPRDWLDTSLIFDCFMDWLEQKNIQLYPAQEEAILALYSYKNVILNTPTGSGKSLVATALHLYSWAWGRRSVYTSPIKALVNEKFLALCKDFGARNVGMITGDAAINRNAPILCCTAEILANIGLRDGNLAGIDDVIIDEFHYYSDKERGVAWQIPLLTLPNCRFLLMSATLGDTAFFEEALTKLNGLETIVVRSTERPVPLEFIYQETPLYETVTSLINNQKAPIYLVHFTQREAAEQAQNFLSIDFCTREEKRLIAQALEGVKFPSVYGKDMQKFLRHGIGLHHAGLLPRYRVLVERLAQQGLLKIICGTDTLGVGVNIPIRTVVFTKLCKFDGEKNIILPVRDFQQIAGRAGRKGFDEQGTVVVQAPEHVIENLRLEEKIKNDPRKKNKIVKKQPPEKGFVNWNRETFERLVNSPPEKLVSRFSLSHGMLLHVLSRGRDGVRAMREILRNCHETEVTKKKLRKEAWQLFRALLERKLVEIVTDEQGRWDIQVNVNLQEDFSLHHALSLYLIDTIQKLDMQSPTYAFDVLSLVEAIIEDPELILRKQVDKLKSKRLRELKDAGVEYEARVAELENIEHPKPNAEFIYSTFQEFASRYPWLAKDSIKPKSIAREMYEHFYSFNEYVRDYGIQRIEGTLLRYITYVFKTLIQTVPDTLKTDEVKAMEAYFGSMVRDVDTSLIEEWHMLCGMTSVAERDFLRAAEDNEGLEIPDITRDTKAFTLLVRNDVFRLVRALAAKDWEEVLNLVSVDAALSRQAWTIESLEERMKSFYGDSEIYIRTDQHARSSQFFNMKLSEDGFYWLVEQTLCDSEEHYDWALYVAVDIERSRDENKPVLILQDICERSQFVS